MLCTYEVQPEVDIHILDGRPGVQVKSTSTKGFMWNYWTLTKKIFEEVFSVNSLFKMHFEKAMVYCQNITM